MGFFHKLATGLKRFFNSNSIDYVSERKSYGNDAEFDFKREIENALPGCNIKTNVLIETMSGRCEIDCLLKYNDKLFIIEVKHWKGILTETCGVFISEKNDKYTGEIHEKEVKSPFLQVKRQVHLLKEFTNSNPWINTIVYFCGADEINFSSDNIWFDDINELVFYIKNEGYTSRFNELSNCYNKAVEADYLYSSSFWGERSLHCIVDDDSLSFVCSDDTTLIKKQIRRIDIVHHFSYDDINITLKDGTVKTSTVENKQIMVRENGMNLTYSLAKIETIILGN